LASGGLVATLLATINGAQGAKLVGAVIAFLSGTLSLVATTYFDIRDTQKISDGASDYGVLIDQLDNLEGRLDDIQPKTATDGLIRIREKASLVRRQIDPYLPVGKRYFDEARFFSKMADAFPDILKHILRPFF
jgi:hypothetical protein